MRMKMKLGFAIGPPLAAASGNLCASRIRCHLSSPTSPRQLMARTGQAKNDRAMKEDVCMLGKRYIEQDAGEIEALAASIR